MKKNVNYNQQKKVSKILIPFLNLEYIIVLTYL